MDYCIYYQAQINKQLTWFFVGCLKSSDHMAFDRTLDAEQGIFEFFVPIDMENQFVSFLHHFEQLGIVRNIQKKRNRLIDEPVQQLLF